jgi:hypothetical protein
MFSTIEAALVAFVALIPGATYVWCVERWVGRWGAGLSDALLRFAGVSAVLHFLLAPLTFVIVRRYQSVEILGRPFPWTDWFLVGLYLGVPAGIGSVVGLGIKRQWRPVRFLSALRPPRAWDHVLAPGRTGWVKVKLKSGPWVGGWFGSYGEERAYAAGHPYPSDIFLVRTLGIDQRTGAFLVDRSGRPAEVGPGILVGWDEIEYLKFIKEAA